MEQATEEEAAARKYASAVLAAALSSMPDDYLCPVHSVTIGARSDRPVGNMAYSRRSVREGEPTVHHGQSGVAMLASAACYEPPSDDDGFAPDSRNLLAGQAIAVLRGQHARMVPYLPRLDGTETPSVRVTIAIAGAG